MDDRNSQKMKTEIMPHQMTEETISAFLESENCSTPDVYRHKKGYIYALYRGLPDGIITAENLAAWRQGLVDAKYSSYTITNYVKSANHYLRFIGQDKLCFSRGKRKDLTGQKFGYLTAIEPTGEKHRKDYVWRCKCDCGKEIELPATRLLTGNTLSCGCLWTQKLKAGNKYIDGTCISLAKKERVKNPDNISGYVGVTPKRDKWRAYIKYKGVNYNLGTYSNLEDAVKARARAKEAVMEDAAILEKVFDELHSGIGYPNRENVRSIHQVKSEPEPAQPIPNVVRSNNTSGYPGVSLHRGAWIAKITYKKVSYRLGSFPDKDSAISARKKAEADLKADPEHFVQMYSANCSTYKNK